MLTLIRNAHLYSPRDEGLVNIVLGAGKILFIGTQAPSIDAAMLDETLDAQGAAVIPGLIDAHVHVTGGGGEDGFSTQAPAVPLTGFTRFAVTSVVGLLGTDDETRSTANLLARTRALREEGLSAWCWTGGYHLPASTLTGSVRKDIVSIGPIIGLGELALSDHRSSQPSVQELARVASEVHVAGLMAKKAGVLHLHLGDGPRGLAQLEELIGTTELPARMFHPTHVNRRKALFEEAIALTRLGCTVDVTAFPVGPEEDAWSAADAWERYRDAGAPAQQLTVSSDGGGCLPVFDEQGRMLKMDFGSSAGLTEMLSELAGRGHKLDAILPSMTSNVAALLKLPHKGQLSVGKDADLAILDADFRPQHVMANGRWMIRNHTPRAKGLFEE